MKNNLENNKEPIIEEDGQTALDLEFNINNNQDNQYLKERLGIAKKYGILDPDRLSKKDDGKWYIYNTLIEDYDKLMSCRDVDDLYPRDIK